MSSGEVDGLLYMKRDGRSSSGCMRFSIIYVVLFDSKVHDM